MTDQKQELVEFKQSDIDPLLIALGWTYKKKKGTESFQYEKDGQRITTFKGYHEFWRWKNHVTGDGGTIVDLVLADGHGFGQMRQILREMIATSGTPSNTDPDPSQSSSTRPPSPESDEKKSHSDLTLEYQHGSDEARPLDAVPDYLKSRGIYHVFEAAYDEMRIVPGGARFIYKRIRRDERGEIVSDNDRKFIVETAGFETKEQGFVRYVKGGHAGLWIAGDIHTADEVVICESPLDCLSHAIVEYAEASPRTVYIAIRSGAEADCVEILLLMHREMRLNRVRVSTDNDAAGMSYAMKIMAGVRSEKGLFIRYEPPQNFCVDQNEFLVQCVQRDDRMMSVMKNMRKRFVDKMKGDVGQREKEYEPEM